MVHTLTSISELIALKPNGAHTPQILNTPQKKTGKK